jgi:hypothetical protein
MKVLGRLVVAGVVLTTLVAVRVGDRRGRRTGVGAQDRERSGARLRLCDPGRNRTLGSGNFAPA